MDKIVFDANVKLVKDMYEYNLSEFTTTQDKLQLINNKYKNHNTRFSVIIDRNIAIENNDLEFANFLDSIINEMTTEISILNKAMTNENINDVLKQLTFHDKVNIIFYVRDNLYDENFEPYEILDDKTIRKLSHSIINEANDILKKYNKDLKDISKMNPKDVHSLIRDNNLCLDILFATELIR